MTRPWWIELTRLNSGFNFKWQPFSNGMRFDLLGTGKDKQLVNHFEFHGELSSKSKLFLNLQAYAEMNKENVFDFLPITFYIELKPNGHLESAMRDFSAFYKVLEQSKTTPCESPNKYAKKSVRAAAGSKLVPTTCRRYASFYNRYTMPLCHFAGHNLWLLKPTNLNRGQGIHIFHDLETLKQLIAKEVGGEGSGFVVQKYIESPLLIGQRKFDIRVWVLITHELNCYFFKEGYLRTTSTEYKIDLENVDDKFIHLTNNAIQQYSEAYGTFEDGNQISFKKFQMYLEETNTGIDIKDIISTMKSIIKKSLLAARKKLSASSSLKSSFEIFGYDFILDADCNVWLIEVNTNPCLEESSKLLKILLPRMLNDAFRLTLDCAFPPSAHYSSATLKKFPVDGYDDDENMWFVFY
eukprot:TRINITY_DN9586_c0_g1_i5.p1 TRINITY_DN9586_c0_g1~~TRINITY_DN9586_c0_g1_i5.p1  ORF type:complete len:410 (-),score=85.20 TRINITY_DN9586_c0_g1_i5:323-1552(-)